MAALELDVDLRGITHRTVLVAFLWTLMRLLLLSIALTRGSVFNYGQGHSGESNGIDFNALTAEDGLTIFVELEQHDISIAVIELAGSVQPSVVVFNAFIDLPLVQLSIVTVNIRCVLGVLEEICLSAVKLSREVFPD